MKSNQSSYGKQFWDLGNQITNTYDIVIYYLIVLENILSSKE